MYFIRALTRVRIVDVLEVDLDHVKGAVAGLWQLLHGDKLAPDGPGAPRRVEALWSDSKEKFSLTFSLKNHKSFGFHI